MQLEIPSCLGFGPKSFNRWGYDAQAKISVFFLPIININTNINTNFTLLSNNHTLMSYLSGIYLKSWFSWFGGGSQKTLKKRRKQTEEKQKKEKRRMQRKSKNNNKHLWFYLLYKKIYFARKHSLKKSSLYITFYYSFYAL